MGMNSILNCYFSRNVWIYKCLKLDPSFEYRQTQPPSLTGKQECDTAHAHTAITAESDCFPGAASSINCHLFSFVMIMLQCGRQTTTPHSAACQHSFATILLEWLSFHRPMVYKSFNLYGDAKGHIGWMQFVQTSVNSWACTWTM